MNKFTVSLCMIVKNEEQFLDRCLQSVKEQVNEIIIVDTGSTDRTIEIAKSHHAKIFTFEWINDFAAARNYSISQATSDYILVLDADEYLDPSCDLQQVLQNMKDHYTIRIKNHLSSGATILHPAVRLFKNNRGLEYFGSIHEHLNVENKELNLTHDFAELLVHHDGYKEEIVSGKNKHNRNLELLLNEVERNPSGYNLYNLGNQYKANNEFSKALEAYQQAFPLSKDRLFIKYLLYNMIDCLRRLNRYDEALQVVDASIESFPEHTDFHFMQGRIFEEIGYLKDAENSFIKCTKLGEVKLLQTLEGVGSFLSYVRLASIYLEKGQNLAAFDMVTEALKSNRYHMPALKLYFTIMEKTKVPLEQVVEHFSVLYPIQSVDDFRKLIIVLTVSKSPLLLYYIEKFKLKVDPSILGIAKLYAKSYDDAYDFFQAKDSIEQSEVSDCVLLSFIKGDEKLLQKCKVSLNFNKTEWNYLKNIVSRKKVNLASYSNEFEQLLLFIMERVIYFQEDELLTYLINELNDSKFTSISINKVLLENGLPKLLQDILLKDTTTINKSENLELLADACVRQNQYPEALSFYQRAIELKSKYELFEKVYEVYEKINDREGMFMIKDIVKQNYPLTRWGNLEQ